MRTISTYRKVGAFLYCVISRFFANHRHEQCGRYSETPIHIGSDNRVRILRLQKALFFLDSPASRATRAEDSHKVDRNPSRV
jgi:hypothetical protein